MGRPLIQYPEAWPTTQCCFDLSLPEMHSRDSLTSHWSCGSLEGSNSHLARLGFNAASTTRLLWWAHTPHFTSSSPKSKRETFQMSRLHCIMHHCVPGCIAPQRTTRAMIQGTVMGWGQWVVLAKSDTQLSTQRARVIPAHIFLVTEYRSPQLRETPSGLDIAA